jgi:Fe-S-cluster containining protein
MSHPLNVLPQEPEPWYAKGLHFKCTGCGQCCTGAPGYVWVEESEIAEMAAALNMAFDAFTKRYIRKVGDRYSLIEDSKTYDCVFLKDNKCAVYQARPQQCRTFPWWIQNLRSKEDWDNASEFCEGMNHKDAPLVPFETIDEQLKRKDVDL